MTAYVVYGDIHPSMIVHIDDAELKAIQTKLALGIKPEDIRVSRKPVMGRRELGVVGFIPRGENAYLVVSKANYLHLALDVDGLGVSF